MTTAVGAVVKTTSKAVTEPVTDPAADSRLARHMVGVQRAHARGVAVAGCTGRHSSGRTTAGSKDRENGREPSPVTPVITIGTVAVRPRVMLAIGGRSGRRRTPRRRRRKRRDLDACCPRSGRHVGAVQIGDAFDQRRDRGIAGAHRRSRSGLEGQIEEADVAEQPRIRKDIEPDEPVSGS